MQQLTVDFITSLDGYGAAEGWPGWWGIQGPEYLAWLAEHPLRDSTVLMGATTYRQMSGLWSRSDPGSIRTATKLRASVNSRMPPRWCSRRPFRSLSPCRIPGWSGVTRSRPSGR
jgi:dihydrofolate reductase